MKQEINNTKSYISVAADEKTVVSEHFKKCEQLRADVKITQNKLPTMYWLPKLHKNRIKHVSLLTLALVQLLNCLYF